MKKFFLELFNKKEEVKSSIVEITGPNLEFFYLLNRQQAFVVPDDQQDANFEIKRDIFLMGDEKHKGLYHGSHAKIYTYYVMDKKGQIQQPLIKNMRFLKQFDLLMDNLCDLAKNPRFHITATLEGEVDEKNIEVNINEIDKLRKNVHEGYYESKNIEDHQAFYQQLKLDLEDIVFALRSKQQSLKYLPPLEKEELSDKIASNLLHLIEVLPHCVQGTRTIFLALRKHLVPESNTLVSIRAKMRQNILFNAGHEAGIDLVQSTGYSSHGPPIWLNVGHKLGLGTKDNGKSPFEHKVEEKTLQDDATLRAKEVMDEHYHYETICETVAQQKLTFSLQLFQSYQSSSLTPPEQQQILQQMKFLTDAKICTESELIEINCETGDGVVHSQLPTDLTYYCRQWSLVAQQEDKTFQPINELTYFLESKPIQLAELIENYDPNKLALTAIGKKHTLLTEPLTKWHIYRFNALLQFTRANPNLADSEGLTPLSLALSPPKIEYRKHKPLMVEDGQFFVVATLLKLRPSYSQIVLVLSRPKVLKADTLYLEFKNHIFSAYSLQMLRKVALDITHDPEITSSLTEKKRNVITSKQGFQIIKENYLIRRVVDLLGAHHPYLCELNLNYSQEDYRLLASKNACDYASFELFWRRAQHDSYYQALSEFLEEETKNSVSNKQVVFIKQHLAYQLLMTKTLLNDRFFFNLQQACLEAIEDLKTEEQPISKKQVGRHIKQLRTLAGDRLMAFAEPHKSKHKSKHPHQNRHALYYAVESFHVRKTLYLLILIPNWNLNSTEDLLKELNKEKSLSLTPVQKFIYDLCALLLDVRKDQVDADCLLRFNRLKHQWDMTQDKQVTATSIKKECHYQLLLTCLMQQCKSKAEVFFKKLLTTPIDLYEIIAIVKQQPQLRERLPINFMEPRIWIQSSQEQKIDDHKDLLSESKTLPLLHVIDLVLNKIEPPKIIEELLTLGVDINYPAHSELALKKCLLSSVSYKDSSLQLEAMETLLSRLSLNPTLMTELIISAIDDQCGFEVFQRLLIHSQWQFPDELFPERSVWRLKAALNKNDSIDKFCLLLQQFTNLYAIYEGAGELVAKPQKITHSVENYIYLFRLIRYRKFRDAKDQFIGLLRANAGTSYVGFEINLSARFEYYQRLLTMVVRQIKIHLPSILEQFLIQLAEDEKDIRCLIALQRELGSKLDVSQRRNLWRQDGKEEKNITLIEMAIIWQDKDLVNKVLSMEIDLKSIEFALYSLVWNGRFLTYFSSQAFDPPLERSFRCEMINMILAKQTTECTARLLIPKDWLELKEIPRHTLNATKVNIVLESASDKCPWQIFACIYDQLENHTEMESKQQSWLKKFLPVIYFRSTVENFICSENYNQKNKMRFLLTRMVVPGEAIILKLKPSHFWLPGILSGLLNAIQLQHWEMAFYYFVAFTHYPSDFYSSESLSEGSGCPEELLVIINKQVGLDHAQACNRWFVDFIEGSIDHECIDENKLKDTVISETKQLRNGYTRIQLCTQKEKAQDGILQLIYEEKSKSISVYSKFSDHTLSSTQVIEVDGLLKEKQLVFSPTSNITDPELIHTITTACGCTLLTEPMDEQKNTLLMVMAVQQSAAFVSLLRKLIKQYPDLILHFLMKENLKEESVISLIIKKLNDQVQPKDLSNFFELLCWVPLTPHQKLELKKNTYPIIIYLNNLFENLPSVYEMEDPPSFEPAAQSLFDLLKAILSTQSHLIPMVMKMLQRQLSVINFYHLLLQLLSSEQYVEDSRHSPEIKACLEIIFKTFACLIKSDFGNAMTRLTALNVFHQEANTSDCGAHAITNALLPAAVLKQDFLLWSSLLHNLPLEQTLDEKGQNRSMIEQVRHHMIVQAIGRDSDYDLSSGVMENLLSKRCSLPKLAELTEVIRNAHDTDLVTVCVNTEKKEPCIEMLDLSAEQELYPEQQIDMFKIDMLINFIKLSNRYQHGKAIAYPIIIFNIEHWFTACFFSNAINQNQSIRSYKWLMCDSLPKKREYLAAVCQPIEEVIISTKALKTLCIKVLLHVYSQFSFFETVNEAKEDSLKKVTFVLWQIQLLLRAWSLISESTHLVSALGTTDRQRFNQIDQIINHLQKKNIAGISIAEPQRLINQLKSGGFFVVPEDKSTAIDSGDNLEEQIPSLETQASLKFMVK